MMPPVNDPVALP